MADATIAIVSTIKSVQYHILGHFGKGVFNPFKSIKSNRAKKNSMPKIIRYKNTGQSED